MRTIALLAAAMTLSVQLIILLVVASTLVSAFGSEFGWPIGLLLYALAVFIWVKLIQRYLEL